MCYFHLIAKVRMTSNLDVKHALLEFSRRCLAEMLVAKLRKQQRIVHFFLTLQPLCYGGQTLKIKLDIAQRSKLFDQCGYL